MNELKRIKKNNELEIPEGIYDIVRVKNVSDPEKELDIFKKTISVFIENKDLNELDNKWKKLLPNSFVKFTDQLTDNDFGNDDIIQSIPSILNSLKDEDIREWEWYSSKVTENGFEVIMNGIFRGIFLPLLHQQGIPHKSLFIERNGVEYPTKALTDVLTYRTWNAETLELK